MPGVRKAIEQMNAQAAADKLPQIKSEPLIALAESLAPVLKAAEWHDRADAALAGIAEIDLRDIRSVVAAADRAARSDETRALAESLRSGLAQRLELDHRKWLDELASTIHDGRTVRALRLSSRPPKAGAPLPPDMAERLASIAAADLNSTASQQRWATVVDSVALSPVRTQVVPAGIPEKPSDDLLSAIRKVADRVPQISALFGVSPAPPARRGGRRPPPPPAAPQPTTAEQTEATTPAEATEQAEATPSASVDDQAKATSSAGVGDQTDAAASADTQAEAHPASDDTQAEATPSASADTQAEDHPEPAAGAGDGDQADAEASEQTEPQAASD